MANLIKTLIVLILAFGIFGAGGYFIYDLFIKPEKLIRQEQAVLPAEPTPTPDYSLPEFEKAAALHAEGKIDEARAALSQFMDRFPASPNLNTAKKLLGEINSDLLLSTLPTPDKEAYVVVRGDALAKISSKTKSDSELIFRVNNLESINLQIGQQLLIPRVDTSVIINRQDNTLLLLNNGEFFKEYPILSFLAPNVPAGQAIETRVNEKLARVGDKRVAFGSKEYFQADRSISLVGSGLMLRSAPTPAEEGQTVTMPPGIVLAPEDMEEVFILVTRGTPVKIQ